MKEAGYADWSTRNQLYFNWTRQFAHKGLDSRITFCAVPHVDFAMQF